jgi:hypothetical protein
MPSSPTEVIQSFRLRFWREPRQGASGVWRGDIWHEQQNPGEEAVAVADPDEAFELVRNRLHVVSQGREARDTRKDHPDNRGEDGSDPNPPKFLRCFLVTVWRKLRSSQP